MREIKFRAWNKTEKQMCNSQYLHIQLDGELELMHYERENGYSDNVSYKFILMQYTGLKDKNGKEIYEGDLLKFTEIDEDSAFGREDTDVVEVKWIDDIAQYRAVFKSGRRTELHFVIQPPIIIYCEVIGNIYENPELLTNK